MSKRGLGRGLGALLGEGGTADLTRRVDPASSTNDAASGDDARGNLRTLPVRAISPNPFQPRTTFDPAALEELRASVAAFGVLVPVLVRERGGAYELIAGERRLRAAQMAGLETIPAIVRESDDRDALEVAIVENLQRENLDPLEEAMGFAHLMEAYDFTQERVAERVGKSRPAVANALRLLSLPDAIKALVREGRLSAGHARALLAHPPERREPLARRAAAEGLSVRALERLAHGGAARKPGRSERETPGRDDEALIERLRYKFATHVRLVPQGRGGTIELRYADASDLMRIADLLLEEDS